MRYVYSENDLPKANDYYYEARHTTNINEFPFVQAHSHNFYEIYMFLSGSVRLFVEDTFYNVELGDIIIIPPYTIHQLYATDPPVLPYMRMYMYISEPCLKSFQFNEHNPLHTLKLATSHKRYHFHIDDEKEYNSIKYCMRYVYDSKKSDYYGKEMLNRSCILHLITLLCKNIVESLEPQGIIHTNPMIENVLSYINCNYTEEISLDTLADHFYINKSTLSKEFKEYTGQTIHSYLIMKRINTAKQDMSNGVSPTQVYLSTGFKDYSTFYRTFQKYESMSPKEFYYIGSASESE